MMNWLVDVVFFPPRIIEHLTKSHPFANKKIHWVHPPTSKSHHQENYMFRGFGTKPSLFTGSLVQLPSNTSIVDFCHVGLPQRVQVKKPTLDSVVGKIQKIFSQYLP